MCVYNLGESENYDYQYLESYGKSEQLTSKRRALKYLVQNLSNNIFRIKNLCSFIIFKTRI